MRLCALIFCTVLVTTCADPEPKKYKSEAKDKQSNTTLTSDEQKFIRDVEEKFGIKSETPAETKNNDTEVKSSSPAPGQTPFPAVIAIEIVNDTDTKTKGKRTIDANLGYGYKTNTGYTYSYFGKPTQEKGRFMIYPYSQEDIPTSNQHGFHNGRHYDRYTGKNGKTSVEIQPSQAFELVPVKDEKASYHYRKPSVEFKTPSQGYSSEYSSSHGTPASTLFTTYNGEQFSGLSGQFPSVMSNYLVDPTQLLKNPEYQNVGLTQDHLRQHGSHLEQKVVPVLVLRIPSSSLTNPTAELYANLPQNYPLSNYLNNVNLQELVNQYFKKSGYSFAPQVTFTSSHASNSASSALSSVSQYEPQHYAHPYVQPSYTQSDHSGVQYSAVQPVMARYPSSYMRHHYSVPKGQSLYKQPSVHQKYEYQYQYVPQSYLSSQKLYYQPQYHQQAEQPTSHEVQETHSSLGHQTSQVYDNTQEQYELPAQVSSGHETGVTTSVEYDISHPQVSADYGATQTAAPEYGHPKEEQAQSIPAGYESSATPSPYESSKPSEESQEYYTQSQLSQQQSLALLQSQLIQPRHKYQSHASLDNTQTYVYQQQGQGESDSGLVLTENYPSNDHTIATVLPSHYKTAHQNSGAIQTVSYVTPMPSSKYQLPYKVMVPQTYLHNPSSEKVTYVNSHSVPVSYSQTVFQHDYNPEAEYTVGYNYVPPISKQKPPSHPRNYHSTHPKRMVKPEKPESMSAHSKKQSDRHEKKRMSS